MPERISARIKPALQCVSPERRAQKTCRAAKGPFISFKPNAHARKLCVFGLFIKCQSVKCPTGVFISPFCASRRVCSTPKIAVPHPQKGLTGVIIGGGKGHFLHDQLHDQLHDHCFFACFSAFFSLFFASLKSPV